MLHQVFQIQRPCYSLRLKQWLFYFVIFYFSVLGVQHVFVERIHPRNSDSQDSKPRKTFCVWGVIYSFRIASSWLPIHSKGVHVLGTVQGSEFGNHNVIPLVPSTDYFLGQGTRTPTRKTFGMVTDILDYTNYQTTSLISLSASF